jgi:hypothetical protein
VSKKLPPLRASNALLVDGFGAIVAAALPKLANGSAGLAGWDEKLRLPKASLSPPTDPCVRVGDGMPPNMPPEGAWATCGCGGGFGADA